MPVDDHAIVRAGVRAMLTGAAPDVHMVGEATGGVEAVALAARLAPHVVIMDLEMPGGDGESATRELLTLPHPPRVLILTMHDERERLLPLLSAGAAGYLAKDATRSDLVNAIRVVAAGDTYVRPSVARRLASNDAPRPVHGGAGRARALRHPQPSRSRPCTVFPPKLSPLGRQTIAGRLSRFMVRREDRDGGASGLRAVYRGDEYASR